MSMICGSDNILAKPTNHNSKVARVSPSHTHAGRHSSHIPHAIQGAAEETSHATAVKQRRAGAVSP
jgi:hypothetical protein